MRKHNLILGLVGGILTMVIAPGFVMAGMYVFALICFITGLAIIDYNRGGQ